MAAFPRGREIYGVLRCKTHCAALNWGLTVSIARLEEWYGTRKYRSIVGISIRLAFD